MKQRIVVILLFTIGFICIDRALGLCINEGLNRYFGITQHSKVLFIGHSHLMLALDKNKFEQETGEKISKYCREGVNVADRYEMIKQYLSLPNSDSLKIVIYGVDQFMFTGEGLSKNSYKLFYPFMDNANIDAYIRRSADFYDYSLHKVVCSTRYSDALLNSAIRGWRGDWSNYKVGQLDVERLKSQVAEKKQRSIHFEQDLIDIFEKTLELLKQRGIITVLINTPIAEPLNQYEPQKYQRIIQYFQDKAKSSSLIHYWDLNPEFSERYDLFFDPIHLNVDGQKVINEEIVKLYNSLFNNNDFNHHSSV